jgi:hypothetical protein
MSSRSKIDVKVKPVPLPRSLVRAQAAGELIHASGGSPKEVEIGQRGVGRQLLEKVLVYGLDGFGHARDMVEFSFTGDASCDVLLDLDGGNRSAIEALDAGLGRAVARAADRMRRRGLTADVRYQFTDEICSDPQRFAAARAELGVNVAAAPNWRGGYQRKEVLRLRPGKDSGILSSFYQEFGDAT